MMIPWARTPRPLQDRGARQYWAAVWLTTKDIFMKWETPQAVDFRFGMEITMYIANR
jgi:coenzyme PQQ precursor peptide PqqA